jgi:hypothetical protein
MTALSVWSTTMKLVANMIRTTIAARMIRTVAGVTFAGNILFTLRIS